MVDSCSKGANSPLFYTDHKPLVHAMAKTGELWSAREHKHLSAVSEYTTDIQHVSGKNHIAAHCLSRTVTTNAVSLGTDYTAVTKSQASSIDIRTYKVAVTGPNIISTKVKEREPDLLCDISTGLPRLIVPSDVKRALFEAVPNLAHPGIKAKVKLVSEKFVWHGMRKQISR